MKDVELTICIKDDPISVKWSDDDMFWELVMAQRSVNSVEVCSKIFEKKLKLLDKHISINAESKVLDIGSGIGILDLFWHLHSGSTFYLLDKDKVETKNTEYFSENHPYYNKRSCTVDAITTSNLNANNFIFLDPDSQLDTDFDVIMSHSSWCWHYPFKTYWDKIKYKLKPGGKLFLEISNQALEEEPNLIPIVSDWFKSVPKITSHTIHHVVDNPDLLWKHGYYGVNAIWSNLRDSGV
jgi:SAM-dependent methyltransferase